jgi:hypothetical protein
MLLAFEILCKKVQGYRVGCCGTENGPRKDLDAQWRRSGTPEAIGQCHLLFIAIILRSQPNALAKSLPWLAGLDIAVQLGALCFPSPFEGVGLVGFALLPVIIAWYLFLLAVVLAGFPLAYQCIRKRWWAPLGAILVVLSVLNLWKAERWYTAQQPTQAEQAQRDNESRKADQVYACMTDWFSVPHRVEDVDGSELVFAGGLRIDVCRIGNRLCGGDAASLARREAFGKFAREHVLGTEVSVALMSRPYFRYEGGNWCANGWPGTETAPSFPGRYSGDVSFRGRRLTVSDQPPRIEDFR